MCHNKFFRFSLYFLFSLYLSLSLWGVCFAYTVATDISGDANDGGCFRLMIKSDFQLKEDISVSITNTKFETEIYLIKAESKQNWITDDRIPVGRYTVNYVMVGEGKSKYTVHYPETVEFKDEKTTEFEIDIKDNSKLGASGRRSFTQIIKANTVNLILIFAGLMVLLVLKRKEDKKYE